MRIGSVPYLNAKPLVDWFHSPDCDISADISYEVPARLAAILRAGTVDVANVSVFEALSSPGLTIIPGISISARRVVKSVRLFSRVPIEQIRTVALDSSSLTSVALLKILLSESFGVVPEYQHQAPDLATMLATCDAGLIIGDLKLFNLHRGTVVYDLGQGWYDLTGLPFVYAAWLARSEMADMAMKRVLARARDWGTTRLPELAALWAARMELSREQCEDYFLNIMDYGLDEAQEQGLRLFQSKCHSHRLIPEVLPLVFLGRHGDL